MLLNILSYAPISSIFTNPLQDAGWVGVGVAILVGLVLHSSKAIGKEATPIARRLGWASPHPGFGSQVKLSSGDARGLCNLRGIGKTLACQRITPEETPTDPYQPSCRLSQHAPVGMKTWWMRGCPSSQVRVSKL